MSQLFWILSVIAGVAAIAVWYSHSTTEEADYRANGWIVAATTFFALSIVADIIEHVH